MAEQKTLYAYADRLEARPGESVSVMVSQENAESYTAQVVRLWGCDTLSPGGVFTEQEIDHPVNGQKAGRRQIAVPGSYGEALLFSDWLDGPAASFGCFIRPTALAAGKQVLFGLDPDALSCFIDEGTIGFDIAGTRLMTDVAVIQDAWQCLGLSVDRTQGRIAVTIVPLAQNPGADVGRKPRSAMLALPPLDSAKGRRTAIRIGAGWDKDQQRHGFFGKIEAPTLWSCALTEEEWLAARARPLETLAQQVPLVQWRFEVAIGETSIAATTAQASTLVLHHCPAQAVTGRLWDGSVHDWRLFPDHYGAIHFHGDDMTNAGWDADFSVTIPDDLPTGSYAVRLTDGDSTHYVPIFVLPPQGVRGSDIAYLAPTATYLAYANFSPFTNPVILKPEYREFTGVLARERRIEASIVAHPEHGLGHYSMHGDGDGVRFVSFLRPMANYTAKAAPWGFTADGDILAYLKHEDIAVDILTDHALHREGAALLAGYRVLITGTHPEYWSSAMMAALQRWIAGGGRLMYLGGNGFYWRVAFHPEMPDVMELRRAEDGTRAWIEAPGQYHHACTGELGGLWRRLGQPPQALCGIGFSGQGFGGAGHFVKTAAAQDRRAAFIFNGVPDEVIGDFGAHGGGAVGEEIDRADRALGTPAHALIVATSAGLHRSMLRAKEELFLTEPTTQRDDNMRADMTFFETAAGGAVFSTGTISWASALAHKGYDNAVARITGNVLRRFADPKPFCLTDEGQS